MKPFGFALLCACVFAVPTDANALYITTNGDLELVDNTPPPAIDLDDIKVLFGGGGKIFTNGEDSDASGDLSVGDAVRTVSLEFSAGAQNGVPFSDSIFPDLGTKMAMVGAIEGHIAAVTPFGPSVAFTGGRFFIVADPLGTVDPKDPSTWPAPGTAIAEYRLGPVGSVIPGLTGNPNFISASVVNRSTSTTALTQTTNLVILEDSSDAQDAGAVPGGAAGSGGDNFLHNVDDQVAGNPNLAKTHEGFAVIADQTLDLLSFTLDGGDLATMNAFFMAALGKTWATGFGGAEGGSDWTPGVLGHLTGGTTDEIFDFQASFSTENIIVHAVIPEPSSMVLMGMGVLGVGFVGIRRRRNKQQKAAA